MTDEDEIDPDPRLRLPWGVTADGELVAAFLSEGRALQFGAQIRLSRDRKIEVCELSCGDRSPGKLEE
jgi:hypothetical protein